MNLEVGSVLTGKVTGIAKFGAFVSLGPDVSGLVHISEIANTYVNSVEEQLSVGQEVTVKVISIDENKRINLSIKQALPKPERNGDGRNRRNNNQNRQRQGGDQRRNYQQRTNNGQQTDRKRQHDRPTPIIAEKPENTNQAFEDTLKKFLQESDAKMSECGRFERQRSTRKRNGR